MQDGMWLKMMGYIEKVQWDILIYVPMTGWSLSNAYFDGIKYNALTMQNPYNPLNVEYEKLWSIDMPNTDREPTINEPTYESNEQKAECRKLVQIAPWKNSYFETLEGLLEARIEVLKKKIEEQKAQKAAEETKEATETQASETKATEEAKEANET